MSLAHGFANILRFYLGSLMILGIAGAAIACVTNAATAFKITPFLAVTIVAGHQVWRLAHRQRSNAGTANRHR